MNVGNARNFFFFYNKLADRKISLKFFFWYIEAMQTQKMANKTSLVLWAPDYFNLFDWLSNFGWSLIMHCKQNKKNQKDKIWQKSCPCPFKIRTNQHTFLYLYMKREKKDFILKTYKKNISALSIYKYCTLYSWSHQ